MRQAWSVEWIHGVSGMSLRFFWGGLFDLAQGGQLPGRISSRERERERAPRRVEVSGSAEPPQPKTMRSKLFKHLIGAKEIKKGDPKRSQMVHTLLSAMG